MKDEQQRFLNLLGHLPARLTAEQAAWLINCQPHDIPALVASKLIKPAWQSAGQWHQVFCHGGYFGSPPKDRNWLVACQHHI